MRSQTLDFFVLNCALSGVQTLLDAGIVNAQELVRGSSSANVERLSLVTNDVFFQEKRVTPKFCVKSKQL